MAFEGMDVQQVQTLAQHLKMQAANIGNVVHSVDGLMAQVADIWRGRDATEFTKTWQSQHRFHIQAAQDSVQALGDAAHRNAQDQEAASGR